MDELDRTEEMPRSEAAQSSLPPRVLALARGTQRRLALPPPLPPRARRWTPTPPDAPADTPIPAPVARPAMPPIPSQALRRPTTEIAAPAPPIASAVAEPVPSLTEELQLLSAEAEADPTEFYDRPEARAPRRALVIAASAGVLVIVVVLVMVVLARGSSAPSPATAPRELAVTSIPPGASVTLVDRGVATVVGETPITIPLETSRPYDLVLALPGHKTSIYYLAGDQLAPLTLDLRSLVVPARVVE